MTPEEKHILNVHKNTNSAVNNMKKGKSTKEIDNLILRLPIKFYNPELNKPDPSEDEITHSVDVFIIDEHGVDGMAFYNFEDCRWHFHTDTLVDYYEEGAKTKWFWYYRPFEFKDVPFKK
jgi:hypothetical protein